MAKIKRVPCAGNTVIGSVLDCNKKYLERALQDYDKQLYLKWNPYKGSGIGMWELRRRPNEKTMVYKTHYKHRGERFNLYMAEYVESDWINLILEAPILDYTMLTKIREMDTWGHKNWLNDADYAAQKQEEKRMDLEATERKYAIRENKKYASDFRQYVQAGYNPLWFLNNK